tara:strand:+ start:1447 stop:1920 length:474 start_codon:yes stop_codon:yes gene_type:complete
MDVRPLSEQEQAAYGYGWVAKIKASVDFTAADTGTTKTIAIYPSSGNGPVGLSVTRCAYRLVTAFDSTADSAINSLLLEVGDGGDTDRYSAQKELALDGTEITYWASTATTMPFAYTSADTVDALFTVAGGGSPTIAELDSGEVWIFFDAVDLSILG